MTPSQLYWLPPPSDLPREIREIGDAPSYVRLRQLVNQRLNFIQTETLDAKLRLLIPACDFPTSSVRLAILGSSTVAHLHGAIRIAALRRGLRLDTYESQYRQYFQELVDHESALHRFKPTTVLFAQDARYISAGCELGQSVSEIDSLLKNKLDRIELSWRLAHDRLKCTALQQNFLPTLPALFGSNEHRLFGSPNWFIRLLNMKLRDAADRNGVHIIDVEARAAQDGLHYWWDPLIWNRAKQEVNPLATPVYGDLVGRVIAAQYGKSFKCLVMDLDNTLWGGVVGDDGIEGLVLGQGSAAGEAFIAFQKYVQDLSKRGIVLAVCSKNDEANALAPFLRHPEMVLRREDIACFVANWQDKATNIRQIALDLSIGLDAIVFFDDNPFERDLVRRELPMVAVPEVPDDPAFFAQALADAGYFEGLVLTNEDYSRALLYQSNLERNKLKAESTDVQSYILSLEMKLYWKYFDKVGLSRIVQLINKTNQFNLTTRRYSEKEVADLMDDKESFGIQLRLSDRYGDNGIIAIVIAIINNKTDLFIDTWLMSCRVLGRHVEHATLNIMVDLAKRRGLERIIGIYRQTERNEIVKNLYTDLGFNVLESEGDECRRYVLETKGFVSLRTPMEVVES